MSLDGLRAWIGEVERKLGMRTRVFLALAAVAIGLGAAGTYVAFDTRSDAVSESDVQQLQQELEARMGVGAATGGAELSQLEAELDSLRQQVEALQSKGGGGGKGGGAGTSGGAADGGAGGADEQLKDLLDQAEAQGKAGE